MNVALRRESFDINHFLFSLKARKRGRKRVAESGKERSEVGGEESKGKRWRSKKELQREREG